jgi:hypothetical protein
VAAKAMKMMRRRHLAVPGRLLETTVRMMEPGISTITLTMIYVSVMCDNLLNDRGFSNRFWLGFWIRRWFWFWFRLRRR